MTIIPASQLSIEAYHASPRLSSSKLNDFARKGPRFFASLHVTGKATRTPPTEALVFGQSFEDLVYGKPIHELYMVKPAGMSFAEKEGKAWKKDAVATGKEIITQGDYDAMVCMRDSLRENETAMRMIGACRAQTTFTSEYEGTPGLQSRPDWESATGCIDSGYAPFALDLKSTISLAKLASGRGVAEYGYNNQAAMVVEGFERNGLGYPRCFLLAVEKTAPYRSQVIEITPDWLTVGWQWCERQLEKIAGHYESNDWPRVEREKIALPPVPAWVAMAGMDDNDDEEAA